MHQIHYARQGNQTGRAPLEGPALSSPGKVTKCNVSCSDPDQDRPSALNNGYSAEQLLSPSSLSLSLSFSLSREDMASRIMQRSCHHSRYMHICHGV